VSGSVAAEDPDAGTATASPSRGAIEVHGRIQDERGFPLTEEDGTMRLATDGREVPVEARIAGGNWRTTVPAGTTLTFEDIRFGDRKAIAVPATVPVSEWGMDVRCRWLVPTRLRVIGEKGEDLEAVDLVEDTTPDGDLAPPDERERFLTGGSSPVELSCAEGAHTYWVRARDHAWSRITIFVGFGGERVVRLVRAGALDVRLEPSDPERILLYLTRLDTELHWQPDESGGYRIRGLPPGRYTVRAQFTEWEESPGLAEAEVEIEPGITKELVLPIRDLPPPPLPAKLVPLEGSLRVAPGWSEEDEAPGNCMTATISAVSLRGDSVYVEPDEDGRWWADPVPPGRYYFRLAPWTWLQAVDVGPRGCTDVQLVVPPPCDVEVHLVDGSGRPIPAGGDLHWHVKSPEVERELPFCAESRSTPCAGPGVYRFRAPVGTLVVGLWDDILYAEDTEVELRPGGLNGIDLKAVWNLSVDLAFKEGAMPVPADPGFSDRIQVTPLGGDGKLECCGDGDPCRLWVTTPGRYRVSFPAAIEGYEPVAPIEVEVAAGRIARVEVQLKRRGR
jgi:hypothetical protein